MPDRMNNMGYILSIHCWRDAIFLYQQVVAFSARVQCVTYSEADRNSDAYSPGDTFSFFQKQSVVDKLDWPADNCKRSKSYLEQA